MVMKASCFLTILLFSLTVTSLCAEDFILENFIGQNVQVEQVAKKTKEKKSKNKKSKSDDSKNEDWNNIIEPETKIKIDASKTKKNAGYFFGIDSDVLNLVEYGSPESLMNAYAKIRKKSGNYAENEKVLIFVMYEIAKMVWPSQNIDIKPPAVTQRNAYTGAIESVHEGIYDTSTGNVDFLACTLPSLILCGSISRSDYYQQAEQDLAAALYMNPESVLANYLIGVLYYKMGKHEKSVARFRAALQKTSAFEINFALAASLNALGRYGESKSITEELIVLYPSNLSLIKLLAQNAYDTGDYASAERYAVLVLTQVPSDLEMVLFRAKVFVRMSEYLKAASLLDVYAKTNANAKDYLVLRARVQKEWNKNINAAIATIEKALFLYPNDGEVILCAAELAGESGKTIGGMGGEELSEKILTNDPENPTALSFLIQTLVNEEKWAQAYASSKKLMEKKTSTDIISNHVKICLALGYNNEAWDNAAALYEKSQTEEKAIQTYVEAMVRTGKTVQATRFINSSISNASSAMKSFLYYQRSFLFTSESAQLADLRSAVIANPRNSDALFRMYRIYYQKTDYRKAQYYLRQVIALNPSNSNYLKLNSDLDKLIK